MGRRLHRHRSAGETAPPGVHSHAHVHGDERHEHPHHHVLDAGEEHAHGHAFERYTLLCSPVHALDPRAKVLAAVTLSLAIVLAPPLDAPALLGVVTLLLAVATLARLPLGWLLRRSALVIPFAGTIALFAPLGGGSLSVRGAAEAYASGGWIEAYAVVTKAWLTTLSMLLAASTTPTPLLLKGLEGLRVPRVMLLMMTFTYRYVTTLRGQLSSAREALESRGFATRGWRKVRLYGNLSGTMFIRGYERAERVYAAMLSRGFDGSLPTARPLRLRPADAAMLALAALTAAALLLR
ncbi:MAG: cobalt ECF transporter T component CbiQ [Coriobacteriia bacterium]|nr:cobalt ECF transporter T component CbiQ [Coriobacteriia bacterium]